MSKNQSSYRHILKYTGIFGSIQVVTVLASILRNKAAAVLIDRFGQGLNSIFNNAINLISTATTLVVPVSTIRRLSHLYEKYGDNSEEIKEEIKVVRSWSVLTGLFATLLVIIASSKISQITFNGTQYTHSYMFLSPMLMMLSINGTEIAILKATRRLKQLTTATAISSVATLAISYVCYSLWQLRGVVISLNCCLLVASLLSLYYTLKAYPYKAAPFRWSVLRKGGEIIKLSIAFILASCMAALAEFIIRTYISNRSGVDYVGLYEAGYILTVTYTRFIFSAMDADFYPRLSGICDDTGQMNICINRQIVVCVLLIVPCLLLFTSFLPQVVSMLYTEKYMEVIPMVMYSTLFMFSKAIITPVAYTSLAKGDSKMFFTIETVSALLLGACVIGGYHYCGLAGCGIGLAMSNFLEMTIIFVVYKIRYGVSVDTQSIFTILFQFIILIIGLATIKYVSDITIKYSVVAVLIAVSITNSLRTFRKEKK